MSVPVVDFSPFYHGTALEQAQLATRITQELQKNGAVRLVNHKISAEMISECYEWVSSPQSVPSCISIDARKERARIMPDLVPTECKVLQIAHGGEGSNSQYTRRGSAARMELCWLRKNLEA